MLTLLVAVVLVVAVAATPALGATVGVGVVPAGVAAGVVGRRGIDVLPGVPGVLGGVHAPGVGVGVGVGLPSVVKPARLPVIPQYARTFGSFSGSLTGFIRDQWESRDGSYVRGGYTLVDADGSLVAVEYSSDPINGFRVVVKRSGFPDYFLDSIVLGGPLPGGYLPPFYSDFGFDYSDDYYGYDFDSYYDGLGYDYDYIPSYYSDYGYSSYAPSFLDTYDYDLDYDLDSRRRRRSTSSVESSQGGLPSS